MASMGDKVSKSRKEMGPATRKKEARESEDQNRLKGRFERDFYRCGADIMSSPIGSRLRYLLSGFVASMNQSDVPMQQYELPMEESRYEKKLFKRKLIDITQTRVFEGWPIAWANRRTSASHPLANDDRVVDAHMVVTPDYKIRAISDGDLGVIGLVGEEPRVFNAEWTDQKIEDSIIEFLGKNDVPWVEPRQAE